MTSLISTDEEDRARRRDRASVASGLGVGAGLGALVTALASPFAWLIVGAGALAGGAVGKIVGLFLPRDDWDPPLNRRSYVGARSPDDDITRS